MMRRAIRLRPAPARPVGVLPQEGGHALFGALISPRGDQREGGDAGVTDPSSGPMSGSERLGCAFGDAVSGGPVLRCASPGRATSRPGPWTSAGGRQPQQRSCRRRLTSDPPPTVRFDPPRRCPGRPRPWRGRRGSSRGGRGCWTWSAGPSCVASTSSAVCRSASRPSGRASVRAGSSAPGARELRTTAATGSYPAMRDSPLPCQPAALGNSETTASANDSVDASPPRSAVRIRSAASTRAIASTTAAAAAV
jgi:hypothetical protein